MAVLENFTGLAEWEVGASGLRSRRLDTENDDFRSRRVVADGLRGATTMHGFSCLKAT